MKRHFPLLAGVFTGLLLLTAGLARASHIRAADITAKRISATSLTYEFTIIGYRDSGSPVEFSAGELIFGDGIKVQLDLSAKSIDRVEVDDPFFPLEQVTVVIEHTFSSPGIYIVGYIEPNRNSDILNMDNSVNTRFYFETQVLVDPVLGMNSSPKFQTIPFDEAFVGVKFTHNSWAMDPDGDSLSYKLISVKQAFNSEVKNYRLPNSVEFYESPINYNSANEEGSGPPTFALDPITGELSWDSPGNYTGSQSLPEYNIAFIVEEWRKVSGSWKRIGYVTRDMQIIVAIDFSGSRPNGSLPEDVDIEIGQRVTESIQFSDPDGDSILVESYSELFSLETNPASHSTIPIGYQTGPVAINFDWTPNADQIDQQPYLVHFKVTDKPKDQFELPKATYLTWKIGKAKGPEVITAINDPLENDHVSLYPNPAKDVIKLKMDPEGHEVDLSIRNQLGQILNQTIDHRELIEFNLSAYKPGVYFLHATSKDIQWTKRFIKL